MATGHLEKRYKSSWTIVIDAGRDENGERIRITKSVKGPKRDAEKEMVRMLHELEEGIYVKPTELTVADYLQHWLKDYGKANLADSTLASYEMIIKKHLIPELGKYKLDKLQPMHIQSYYSKALQEGRKDGKGGLSPRTVQYHHRVLREALQHAVKWQILKRNVADAVEPPKQRKKEMTVLDRDGVIKLLETAKGHPDEALITVAVYTGLRQAELLALKWEDIDFAKAQIHVKRTLQRIPKQGFSFKDTKTKRSRRQVSITPKVIGTLKKIKENQGTGIQLVFSNADGTPMDRSIISHRFKALAEKASFPGLRFHDLRHTHATLLLTQGVHPKIVQERLGHESINITLDTYSHVLPGLQEAAATKLEELLETIGRQRNGNGDLKT